MIRRPPSSTLIDPLFPYPPLFRFELGMFGGDVDVAVAALEAGEVPFLALPAIAAPPHLVDEVGRQVIGQPAAAFGDHLGLVRSEEHTSELQSLMRISYAVFCLKKKT